MKASTPRFTSAHLLPSSGTGSTSASLLRLASDRQASISKLLPAADRNTGTAA